MRLTSRQQMRLTSRQQMRLTSRQQMRLTSRQQIRLTSRSSNIRLQGGTTAWRRSSVSARTRVAASSEA
jgi:uncharacterized protein (DUF2345 family)